MASGAAEQCGRAVVPDVAPTASLDQLIAEPFEGSRIVLLDAVATSPLSSVPASPQLLLLVGPAGGFEEAEVERLTASGFRPAGLGPRTLRSETAAVAAVAAAQTLWGDFS